MSKNLIETSKLHKSLFLKDGEEGEGNVTDPNAPPQPPAEGEAAEGTDPKPEGEPAAEGEATQEGDAAQEGETGEEVGLIKEGDFILEEGEIGEDIDEFGDQTFELVEGENGEFQPKSDDELEKDPDRLSSVVVVNSATGSKHGTPSSRKMTPLKKMLSGVGSIRSGVGSIRSGGSKSGSKHGSKAASKFASPAISNKSRMKQSRAGSLHPVSEEHQVEFSPALTSSRRPSRLHVPGASTMPTPSHGVLKTPRGSIGGTPRSNSLAVPNSFNININKDLVDLGVVNNAFDSLGENINNIAGTPLGVVEKGLQRNANALHGVVGTPLQRLRSRADSLTKEILGSNIPSRLASRAVTPIGSNAGSPVMGRKASDLQDVDKTLELAADALVEQQGANEGEKPAEAATTDPVAPQGEGAGNDNHNEFK